MYRYYRRHTAGRRAGGGEAGETDEFSCIGGNDKGDVELSDGGTLKRATGCEGNGAGNPGRGWGRTRDTSASFAGVRSILRKTWPHAYSVAAIYAVTLTIFPGFLAEDVTSESLGDWYPLMLLATFDLADMAGKMAPGWLPGLTTWMTPGRLVGLSTTRLLFIPAFLMTTKYGPQALYENGEVPCVVLTIALGLTNGYYSSVAMMAGPKAVAAREAETCGTVMVFFLLVGLTTGAICGWLWLL